MNSLAILAAVLVACCVVVTVAPLRRLFVSRLLLRWYRGQLPAMSQTEREAIDAGTVWWDGDLFSGRPDWNKLLAVPRPRLTAEEQSFLDNETEQLCAMVSDWETTQIYQDLPPQAWQFIKDKGFLGMIIPKRYGGKEFSATMHSQVIQKLASRCGVAAVHVMVPNSLGPAELLLHYGTEEQKNHYLPRLAKGLEIPCFGLTNPHAGSDAAAIPDFGVVCKGSWEGKEILGMRVTWEKRYITLGPISTLLGLAIRLRDPDHLLGAQFGGRDDVGITCVLVPSHTPGVNIGRRHNPLNAVFQNGPNWGKEVFMPLDWIIGGSKMAGQGWRMLMECLAAGRSISLPSSSTGYTKLAVRATGAYARVRSQFKTAIGKFEGIEEPLARIGANLYTMDAARAMTAGAVDLGEKPSVISAIVKYHLTERGRAVINDAMDILGGKGICLGPNNFMGRSYQQLPIAITVEGANILTRNLIVFGQGAIRCHPYVLKEMHAARDGDLAAFDRALFGHVRHVIANKLRAFFMALTGSRFAAVPSGAAPQLRRYYRHLTRMSSALAYAADVSMLALGGSLKRRERISARLGDVLSMLYLASATLKRFEDEGRQEADLPLVHWSLQDALARAAEALHGVVANYPSGWIGAFLRTVIFPLGRHFAPPQDRLGHEVARLLIAPSAVRERLCAGMYLNRAESDPLGCLEAALEAAIKAEAVEARIRTAQKSGTISGTGAEELAQAAFAAKVISGEDVSLLKRAAQLRDEVIRVDHFPQDLGRAEAGRPAQPQRAAA
ncbi:MAG TPA: acyl-CoA dehydrogenase [Burkholderiales bacterium]|nr:acyl-CoA dehydrogenase [Burkholderiales bacterium]